MELLNYLEKTYRYDLQNFQRQKFGQWVIGIKGKLLIKVIKNYPVDKTDIVAFPLQQVLTSGLDSQSAMVVWKDPK